MSFKNTVKRIFDPPKAIEELKFVLCTRFSELRPLLELEQQSQIRLEFRTQNFYPYNEIDSDVDLVSAFYNANEIQSATLMIKIELNAEIARQLQNF